MSKKICGAYARSTGKPCQAKAMANGRCKNHGGMSTGPRTLSGLVRNLSRFHQHRDQYGSELIDAILRGVRKRHAGVERDEVRAILEQVCPDRLTAVPAGARHGVCYES